MSSLIKWFLGIRFGPWQKVPVNNVHVKKKGEWVKVWEQQPSPPPRKTWGANPDCPKCGARTGWYDIHTHKVFCFGCRDVVYQLHHWPVPSDYLMHHGTIVTHAVPPQLR